MNVVTCFACARIKRGGVAFIKENPIDFASTVNECQCGRFSDQTKNWLRQKSKALKAKSAILKSRSNRLKLKKPRLKRKKRARKKPLKIKRR